MKAVMLILILLFAGGIFFAGFIYPIWALVHCATSKSRSNKSKTIWIIFMILIWPLTSFIYGLIASKKKSFKWISGIAIFVFIILGASYYYLTAQLAKMTIAKIEEVIPKIEQIDTSDLTQNELRQLKESLFVLQEELEVRSFKMDKKEKVASLIQLFDIIIKDDRITSLEYSEWMDKFESRDILERKALKRYIRDLKSRQLNKIESIDSKKPAFTSTKGAISLEDATVSNDTMKNKQEIEEMLYTFFEYECSYDHDIVEASKPAYRPDYDNPEIENARKLIDWDSFELEPGGKFQAFYKMAFLEEMKLSTQRNTLTAKFAAMEKAYQEAGLSQKIQDYKILEIDINDSLNDATVIYTNAVGEQKLKVHKKDGRWLIYREYRE